jgi:hypothetical protein
MDHYKDVSVSIFHDVECKIETPKALMVDIDGNEVWIPKSCVNSESIVQGAEDYGTLIISESFAKEAGLL